MDDRVIKIVNEARWADGLKVRNRLEDITYNPMRSQEEFLMRLLRENARTEYGVRHGFEHIRTMDDFRRYVPLTSYDDYVPYIERIVNDDRNIMEDHHIGTKMVSQLWPGLRCIMVSDVDSLSASFELLRTYCGTDVHFIFSGICSPEGTFTTALNLDDPQTVLIPDCVFYEFKPKGANDNTRLLTLDQLEIGRSYELIVTTFAGLYRYKTQKTLLVAGRYHDTPTVIIDAER